MTTKARFKAMAKALSIDYECCECLAPLKLPLFKRKIRDDVFPFCNEFCADVYEEMVDQIEAESGESIYTD